MDCIEVRRTLWPADLLRVSDAETEAALAHAENCRSCSRFLEGDRRLAQLIRDSVPRAKAPAALRERLYTALARERAGDVVAGRTPRERSASPRTWQLAVAVLLLLGLGAAAMGRWLGTTGPTGGEASSPAAAFAEDYLRRVMEREELRSGDAGAVAAFFVRELGVAMSPPQVPGFQLRRASICLMNGRRGGMVEYERDGQELSYYLIPHRAATVVGAPGLDARRVQIGEPGSSLASERGLSVVTWWSGGHQHALVASLPPSELEDLAPLFFRSGSRL